MAVAWEVAQSHEDHDLEKEHRAGPLADAVGSSGKSLGGGASTAGREYEKKYTRKSWIVQTYRYHESRMFLMFFASTCVHALLVLCLLPWAFGIEVNGIFSSRGITPP